MNKSIRQLKFLFEETITTVSIAEPIYFQTKSTYLDYANQNNYDTVVVNTNDENELLCWDRFDDNKLHLIKHSDIITDSTPLLEVVRLLVKKKRLFVYEKNKISYIVTISDLEKMPVRIWLFGIISLTEMELKNLINSHYQSDKFIDKLSNGRKIKTLELYSEKQKRNVEIKVVDCLQYCDIETIIKRTPAIINSFNGAYKKSDLNILSEAEKLRNMLAHSQRFEMPWEEILAITELLESLLNNIAEN